MTDLAAIIKTAERAVGILRMLEPVLGVQTPFVKDGLAIVGKVLTGVKFGSSSYSALLAELDGVVTEMEAVRTKGGVVGDDFKLEVAKIKDRGNKIDAILAGLKG